jgi:hypothetical protein
MNMKFFREYGLLVAVLTPVLVIAGMQVYLFVAGERGTLLFPSLEAYKSIAIEAAARPRALLDAGTELPRTVFVANGEHDDPLDRIAA